MLNGLQFMVHLPCFAARIPPSQLSIIGQIISVATFDIPYLEMDTLNLINENAFKIGEAPKILEEPHKYVSEN